MSEKAIILIKYATRGRVSRFFDGMESIYNNCTDDRNIRVLVTADEDDLEMNCDEVRERLLGYRNVEIIYGVSTGKINAINRDFDKLPESFKDWQIIANFSDDQRFTIWGWDELIRADFEQVSPNFTHFMAYLDVDTGGRLSTLYIAGRKFFDLFGWVYDPVFLSLWCDNLVEDVAKYLNLFHYTGYTIYQHLLPSYGHLEQDEMHKKQQEIGWSIDTVTYQDIIKKGIPEYLKQFGL